MILNEDNAASYAYGLKTVFSKEFKQEGDIIAFGGSFNNKRLKQENPSIFNYKSKDDFVNEVLENFKTNYTKIYNKYKEIIKDLAASYAVEKMKISKKGTASVTTYFNY